MLRIGQILLLHREFSKDRLHTFVLASLIELVPDIMPSWSLGVLRQIVCLKCYHTFSRCVLLVPEYSYWWGHERKCNRKPFFVCCCANMRTIYGLTLLPSTRVLTQPRVPQMCKLSHPKVRCIGTDRKWKEVIVLWLLSLHFGVNMQTALKENSNVSGSSWNWRSHKEAPLPLSPREFLLLLAFIMTLIQGTYSIRGGGYPMHPKADFSSGLNLVATEDAPFTVLSSLSWFTYCLLCHV